MEVTILGSAAAEGIPSIFCDCETCRKAWERGGKDIRLRTAYKLNDRVRIDFGPDLMAQEYRYQLHSERLRHLLITHPHEDHLYPDILDYRHPGFAVLNPDNQLTVYGNGFTMQEIRAKLVVGDKDRQLKLQALRNFEPFEIPEEDMTVHMMAANHFALGNANIYVIRQGDKYLLIGNDTGYFPESTWDYLARQDFTLDIVILDATCGPGSEARNGHMGGHVPIEVRDRLKEIGRIDGHTQVYVNHFSHNGHALHADLEAFYNPFGIQVGYDGCVITA